MARWKRGKGILLLQEGLGDGWQGTAHVKSSATMDIRARIKLRKKREVTACHYEHWDQSP